MAYGSVVSELGHRLRTIVTKPKGATGRLPGLFLAGWLSCDSVESPVGEPDGFARLLRHVMTQSGYVVMRMDKPGIGDSEGPACAETDFRTELAGYRAAFQAFASFGRRGPRADRRHGDEQRRRLRPARNRQPYGCRFHRQRRLGKDVARAHAGDRAAPANALGTGPRRVCRARCRVSRSSTTST